MRILSVLGVAVVVLVALPAAASAQCSAPSVDRLCISKIHVYFGDTNDIPRRAILADKPSQLPTPAAIEPAPIDCGMIKRPDPQFKSAMPIVTPDPKIGLPMKIIRPPACKG